MFKSWQWISFKCYKTKAKLYQYITSLKLLPLFATKAVQFYQAMYQNICTHYDNRNNQGLSMTFTSSYKMWEEKQKEPPGYALSFKGVLERYSLLQLFSALYFRDVQEKLVMTQNSPVEKHDAIIQRARSSNSKGDITSHLAKKRHQK